MIELEGEYTTAKIFTDEVEENAREQIQEMVNHEAFQNRVRIMPDTHWGQGAVIGFTMPLKDRVCPNTIGVDVGCGMLSANFGKTELGSLEEVDNKIRQIIPTGFSVHDRNNFHMKNDFPWHVVSRKFERFMEGVLDIDPNQHGCVDDTYLETLCEKVDYDLTRAINSVGTLGGGNHFIELGYDKKDELWCTIHSGSRGIGCAIAQYHQERATKLRNKDNGYNFDREQLEDLARETFEGETIGNVIGYLKQMQQTTEQPDRNTDLDYLEGEEAIDYYRDMMFAQVYASENRRKMMRDIEQALDLQWNKGIESVHNYIDFGDGIIRKGATRVHKGARAIIPLNMKDGVLIVEGKGNEDWNKSVCHGAGRVMGRREAESKLDKTDVEEQMSDIYSSTIPIDEAPDAYKPSDFIKESIEDTVTLKNHIEPVLNIKDG